MKKNSQKIAIKLDQKSKKFLTKKMQQSDHSVAWHTESKAEVENGHSVAWFTENLK